MYRLINMLIQKFKYLRRRCRITQKAVAERMNEVFGTKYTKSGICNYEAGNTPASIDRALALLKCVGAEVTFMIKEPINWKFQHFTAKMPEKDKERLFRYIESNRKISLQKKIQETDIEEIGKVLFVENYINHFVDVVSKKNGVAFLFLEKDNSGKYEYTYI